MRPNFFEQNPASNADNKNPHTASEEEKNGNTDPNPDESVEQAVNPTFAQRIMDLHNVMILENPNDLEEGGDNHQNAQNQNPNPPQNNNTRTLTR